MATQPTTSRVTQIADRVLSAVKDQYGHAWDNLLSPEDQNLLRDTAIDAVQVTIDALINPADPKLIVEKRQVNAALANLAACAAGDAGTLVWQAIQVALNGAITLAIAAA